PPYIDWMAKNKLNVGYFFFRDHRRPYWKTLRARFRAMKARGLKVAVGDHFCGSNSRAVRYFIAGVQAFLDETPELDFLGVHPNDGGNWCECPRCRPL